MITITLPMFSNSLKLLHLHQEGKARPIGPAKAGDNRQWVVTDTRRKVVEVGQILKDDVRINGLMSRPATED